MDSDSWMAAALCSLCAPHAILTQFRISPTESLASLRRRIPILELAENDEANGELTFCFERVSLSSDQRVASIERIPITDEDRICARDLFLPIEIVNIDANLTWMKNVLHSRPMHSKIAEESNEGSNQQHSVEEIGASSSSSSRLDGRTFLATMDSEEVVAAEPLPPTRTIFQRSTFLASSETTPTSPPSETRPTRSFLAKANSTENLNSHSLSSSFILSEERSELSDGVEGRLERLLSTRSVNDLDSSRVYPVLLIAPMAVTKGTASQSLMASMLSRVQPPHGYSVFGHLMTETKSNVVSNIPKNPSSTPLHVCALYGWMDCALSILEESPSLLYKQDSWGYTPLHIVLSSPFIQDVEMSNSWIELFISRGANPFMQILDGKNAFEIILHRPHRLEMFSSIVQQYGAKFWDIFDIREASKRCFEMLYSISSAREIRLSEEIVQALVEDVKSCVYTSNAAKFSSSFRILAELVETVLPLILDLDNLHISLAEYILTYFLDQDCLSTFKDVIFFCASPLAIEEFSPGASLRLIHVAVEKCRIETLRYLVTVFSESLSRSPNPFTIFTTLANLRCASTLKIEIFSILAGVWNHDLFGLISILLQRRSYGMTAFDLLCGVSDPSLGKAIVSLLHRIPSSDISWESLYNNDDLLSVAVRFPPSWALISSNDILAFELVKLGCPLYERKWDDAISRGTRIHDLIRTIEVSVCRRMIHLVDNQVDFFEGRMCKFYDTLMEIFNCSDMPHNLQCKHAIILSGMIRADVPPSVLLEVLRHMPDSVDGFLDVPSVYHPYFHLFSIANAAHRFSFLQILRKFGIRIGWSSIHSEIWDRALDLRDSSYCFKVVSELSDIAGSEGFRDYMVSNCKKTSLISFLCIRPWSLRYSNEIEGIFDRLPDGDEFQADDSDELLECCSASVAAFFLQLRNGHRMFSKATTCSSLDKAVESDTIAYDFDDVIACGLRILWSPDFDCIVYAFALTALSSLQLWKSTSALLSFRPDTLRHLCVKNPIFFRYWVAQLIRHDQQDFLCLAVEELGYSESDFVELPMIRYVRGSRCLFGRKKRMPLGLGRTLWSYSLNEDDDTRNDLLKNANRKQDILFRILVANRFSCLCDYNVLSACFAFANNTAMKYLLSRGFLGCVACVLHLHPLLEPNRIRECFMLRNYGEYRYDGVLREHAVFADIVHHRAAHVFQLLRPYLPDVLELPCPALDFLFLTQLNDSVTPQFSSTISKTDIVNHGPRIDNLLSDLWNFGVRCSVSISTYERIFHDAALYSCAGFLRTVLRSNVPHLMRLNALAMILRFSVGQVFASEAVLDSISLSWTDFYGILFFGLHRYPRRNLDSFSHEFQLADASVLAEVKNLSYFTEDAYLYKFASLNISDRNEASNDVWKRRYSVLQSLREMKMNHDNIRDNSGNMSDIFISVVSHLALEGYVLFASDLIVSEWGRMMNSSISFNSIADAIYSLLRIFVCDSRHHHDWVMGYILCRLCPILREVEGSIPRLVILPISTTWSYAVFNNVAWMFSFGFTQIGQLSEHGWLDPQNSGISRSFSESFTPVCEVDGAEYIRIRESSLNFFPFHGPKFNEMLNSLRSVSDSGNCLSWLLHHGSIIDHVRRVENEHDQLILRKVLCERLHRHIRLVPSSKFGRRLYQSACILPSCTPDVIRRTLVDSLASAVLHDDIFTLKLMLSAGSHVSIFDLVNKSGSNLLLFGVCSSRWGLNISKQLERSDIDPILDVQEFYFDSWLDKISEWNVDLLKLSIFSNLLSSSVPLVFSELSERFYGSSRLLEYESINCARLNPLFELSLHGRDEFLDVVLRSSLPDRKIYLDSFDPIFLGTRSLIFPSFSSLKCSPLAATCVYPYLTHSWMSRKQSVDKTVRCAQSLLRAGAQIFSCSSDSLHSYRGSVLCANVFAVALFLDSLFLERKNFCGSLFAEKTFSRFCEVLVSENNEILFSNHTTDIFRDADDILSSDYSLLFPPIISLLSAHKSNKRWAISMLLSIISQIPNVRTLLPPVFELLPASFGSRFKCSNSCQNIYRCYSSGGEEISLRFGDTLRLKDSTIILKDDFLSSSNSDPGDIENAVLASLLKTSLLHLSSFKSGSNQHEVTSILTEYIVDSLCSLKIDSNVMDLNLLFRLVQIDRIDLASRCLTLCAWESLFSRKFPPYIEVLPVPAFHSILDLAAYFGCESLWNSAWARIFDLSASCDRDFVPEEYSHCIPFLFRSRHTSPTLCNQFLTTITSNDQRCNFKDAFLESIRDDPYAIFGAWASCADVHASQYLEILEIHFPSISLWQKKSQDSTLSFEEIKRNMLFDCAASNSVFVFDCGVSRGWWSVDDIDADILRTCLIWRSFTLVKHWIASYHEVPFDWQDFWNITSDIEFPLQLVLEANQNFVSDLSFASCIDLVPSVPRVCIPRCSPSAFYLLLHEAVSDPLLFLNNVELALSNIGVLELIRARWIHPLEKSSVISSIFLKFICGPEGNVPFYLAPAFPLGLCSKYVQYLDVFDPDTSHSMLRSCLFYAVYRKSEELALELIKLCCSPVPLAASLFEPFPILYELEENPYSLFTLSAVLGSVSTLMALWTYLPSSVREHRFLPACHQLLQDDSLWPLLSPAIKLYILEIVHSSNGDFYSPPDAMMNDLPNIVSSLEDLRDMRVPWNGWYYSSSAHFDRLSREDVFIVGLLSLGLVEERFVNRFRTESYVVRRSFLATDNSDQSIPSDLRAFYSSFGDSSRYISLIEKDWLPKWKNRIHSFLLDPDECFVNVSPPSNCIPDIIIDWDSMKDWDSDIDKCEILAHLGSSMGIPGFIEVLEDLCDLADSGRDEVVKLLGNCRQIVIRFTKAHLRNQVAPYLIDGHSNEIALVFGYCKPNQSSSCLPIPCLGVLGAGRPCISCHHWRNILEESFRYSEKIYEVLAREEVCPTLSSTEKLSLDIRPLTFLSPIPSCSLDKVSFDKKIGIRFSLDLDSLHDGASSTWDRINFLQRHMCDSFSPSGYGFYALHSCKSLLRLDSYSNITGSPPDLKCFNIVSEALKSVFREESKDFYAELSLKCWRDDELCRNRCVGIRNVQNTVEIGSYQPLHLAFDYWFEECSAANFWRPYSEHIDHNAEKLETWEDALFLPTSNPVQPRETQFSFLQPSVPITSSPRKHLVRDYQICSRTFEFLTDPYLQKLMIDIQCSILCDRIQEKLTLEFAPKYAEIAQRGSPGFENGQEVEFSIPEIVFDRGSMYLLHENPLARLDYLQNCLDYFSSSSPFSLLDCLEFRNAEIRRVIETIQYAHFDSKLRNKEVASCLFQCINNCLNQALAVRKIVFEGVSPLAEECPYCLTVEADHSGIVDTYLFQGFFFSGSDVALSEMIFAVILNFALSQYAREEIWSSMSSLSVDILNGETNLSISMDVLLLNKLSRFGSVSIYLYIFKGGFSFGKQKLLSSLSNSLSYLYGLRILQHKLADAFSDASVDYKPFDVLRRITLDFHEESLDNTSPGIEFSCSEISVDEIRVSVSRSMDRFQEYLHVLCNEKSDFILNLVRLLYALWFPDKYREMEPELFVDGVFCYDETWNSTDSRPSLFDFARCPVSFLPLNLKVESIAEFDCSIPDGDSIFTRYAPDEEEVSFLCQVVAPSLPADVANSLFLCSEGATIGPSPKRRRRCCRQFEKCVRVFPSSQSSIIPGFILYDMDGFSRIDSERRWRKDHFQLYLDCCSIKPILHSLSNRIPRIETLSLRNIFLFPTPSLEDPLNRSKSGLNDSLPSPSRFLQSIRKDRKELIERKLKIKLEGLISCAPWAVLDCLSYSAIRAEQITFIDTDLIDFSLRSKHNRGLLSSQLQDSRLLGVSFPDVRQIRLVSCYSLSEHVVEGILLVFPGIRSLEIFSSTEKELDYDESSGNSVRGEYDWIYRRFEKLSTIHPSFAQKCLPLSVRSLFPSSFRFPSLTSLEEITSSLGASHVTILHDETILRLK